MADEFADGGKALLRKPALTVEQEQFLWNATGIVVLLAGWEIGARYGVLPTRYVSMPSVVVVTGLQMLLYGTLLHDVVQTLLSLVIGMAAAIAVGIPVGLLAGWYRRFEYAVEPYLAALYSTPSLALVPLLVLWFGIGIRSTTALVMVSALFPIIINVMTGVKTVDPALIKMGRSFRAKQRRIFWAVILPATVPFLASGLQLAVARGLIGVIFGEMYAADNGGLGYIIAVTGSTGAVDQMFVAVSIITALGIILLGITRSLETRLQKWKVSGVQ
jgi:ABC-type nitrate/sulfonate/bicarbonate transport system permease component